MKQLWPSFWADLEGKSSYLQFKTATMDFCVLHELVFNLCVFLALNSQNGDIVPGEVVVMGEEKDNLSSKKGRNSKLVFEQMTKKTQATEVCFLSSRLSWASLWLGCFWGTCFDLCVLITLNSWKKVDTSRWMLIICVPGSRSLLDRFEDVLPDNLVQVTLYHRDSQELPYVWYVVLSIVWEPRPIPQ